MHSLQRCSVPLLKSHALMSATTVLLLVVPCPCVCHPNATAVLLLVVPCPCVCHPNATTVLLLVVPCPCPCVCPPHALLRLQSLQPIDPMSRFNLHRGSPAEEFPYLRDNHTYMGHILTLHLYTRQFNRATESGVMFDDIIRPGLEDPGVRCLSVCVCVCVCVH